MTTVNPSFSKSGVIVFDRGRKFFKAFIDLLRRDDFEPKNKLNSESYFVCLKALPFYILSSSGPQKSFEIFEI